MTSRQAFKVCFCFRRMFKLETVEPPEDVKTEFGKYSENGVMNVDQLWWFLREVQGEKNATRDDAQAIFNSLKHLPFHRRGLQLDEFFRFLLSPDLNSALPPPGQVHHNMDAPLSHYYIYTGHNSYLTGNQLNSDCSIEPIKEALKRGVRVVELDLWPNSTRDDVDVRHGGTLTAPVELISCLRAIRDNAFVASEYPVIITFEDHLTSDLQSRVAQMVIKIFGATLFVPDSDLKVLPSPESLKKRIMISTKPPKEYLESQPNRSITFQEQHDEEEEPVHSKIRAAPRRFSAKDESESEDEEKVHQDEDLQLAVPEYRSLIAIHAGKLKGGMKYWFHDDPNKVRRLSLSEQELENAALTNAASIIRFTQRNLLRIFPKGTRFDSSNYNPLIGWAHGAQMVAFNMQGYGKYLWIMHGMFRGNGGCGYVKKPDFLLNPQDIIDWNDLRPTRVKLKVKVYFGDGWQSDFSRTHFDMYSPPDFYARIGIAGLDDDTTIYRTKIREDSWTPAWNEEFEFPLRVPELAFLRIEVKEYDASAQHDFGGQTCFPVSELKTGIRAVPLHNRKGEKYKNVKLLMRFQFV
ncbi:Phosphoinositide phospholipase C [Bertholletia excelsa]